MAWQIDPAHSQVEFSVRHMMIANVRGRFESFTGTVEFDEADPSRSSVSIQIEAGSINTREPQRDAHLRSPDFLDAEKYPNLYFKSKRVDMLDQGHGRITGDLTIKGISREVILDVKYSGQARSPWGTTSAGFTATGKISRKNWDLNWNNVLETGGVLVGDKVSISIDLELIRVPEAEAEAEAGAA